MANGGLGRHVFVCGGRLDGRGLEVEIVFCHPVFMWAIDLMSAKQCHKQVRF